MSLICFFFTPYKVYFMQARIHIIDIFLFQNVTKLLQGFLEWLSISINFLNNWAFVIDFLNSNNHIYVTNIINIKWWKFKHLWNIVAIIYVTNKIVKKKKKKEIYIYIYIYILWVSVNSTSKVSNGCIRDLGFNPRLYQKLIGVLIWW